MPLHHDHKLNNYWLITRFDKLLWNVVQIPCVTLVNRMKHKAYQKDVEDGNPVTCPELHKVWYSESFRWLYRIMRWRASISYRWHRFFYCECEECQDHYDPYFP